MIWAEIIYCVLEIVEYLCNIIKHFSQHFSLTVQCKSVSENWLAASNPINICYILQENLIKVPSTRDKSSVTYVSLMRAVINPNVCPNKSGAWVFQQADTWEYDTKCGVDVDSIFLALHTFN